MMTIRFILAAPIVALLALPAGAQSANTQRMAMELGTIIGSETACDLAISREGLTAYIEGNVAAEDTEFLSTMNLFAETGPSEIEAMTETQRFAHCLQASRNAAALGILAQ